MNARNNILIGIPIYNEAKNIELLIEKILKLKLPADILILDDNSPDGSGKIADRLSQQNANIKVLHRPEKLGIGSAHQAIIQYSCDKLYDTLVTLDADFAHNPNDISLFLDTPKRYDIVIGTRFKNKDSLKTWSLFRKFMTYAGHFLTRTFLNMKYDATGAFRVYRLNQIPRRYFDLMDYKGYEFFFSSLAILDGLGCKILDIPITLQSRIFGSSKMAISSMFCSVLTIITLSFKIKGILSRARRIPDVQVRKEWDVYWSQGNKKSIYGVIAQFYRQYLIKPSLNKAIKKHFSKGSKLLHAGCGGGETDVDLTSYAKVTALDISPKAIERYKSLHKDKSKTVIGSLFDIPLPSSSFVGIYNLGVMEHFQEDEILEILTEFNRLLSNGGKLVLFWPPVYGLSVIVLKIVHFILNKILRRSIKLHPAEPNKLRSNAQIKRYLESSGFSLHNISFNIKDAFTYAIVVAEKKEKIKICKKTA